MSKQNRHKITGDESIFLPGPCLRRFGRTLTMWLATLILLVPILVLYCISSFCRPPGDHCSVGWPFPLGSFAVRECEDCGAFCSRSEVRHWILNLNVVESISWDQGRTYAAVLVVFTSASNNLGAQRAARGVAGWITSQRPNMKRVIIFLEAIMLCSKLYLVLRF